MKSRITSTALVLAVAGTALTLTLAGCAGATTAAPVHHTHPTKACEIVTPAIIKSALGFAPGKGKEAKSAEGPGSTSCDYLRIKADVSLDSDRYTPAAIYSADQFEGAVKPDASVGADRGLVAPGILFVSKGKISVYVDITGDDSIADGQKLAKAIVAGL